MSFFPLAFIVFSLFLSTFSNGFSVDLIRRDSSKSPFFNSSMSRFDRLGQSIRRSQNRLAHFSSSIESLANHDETTSMIVPAEGEFLMKISIGTPPVDVLAIADTGSDLVWTQCSPCINCYKQDAPLYNTNKSTTYRRVSCNANSCETLSHSMCTREGCSYQMSYGDNSFSRGDLAEETVGLGTTADSKLVKHKGVVFGCGRNNAGTFMSSSSGIIGLGGGKVSFVGQMEEVIHGKFSYCLLPPLKTNEKKSSLMHFGDDAIVAGPGVVSTPIIPKTPDTFYYLTLEGVTVADGPKLDLVTDGDFAEVEKGNIVIDSGTTLTYIPETLHSKLIASVKSAVKKTSVSDPSGLLDLCYEVKPNEEMKLPIITVHFTGADLKLSPVNTFVMTSEGVLCLAFRPAGTVALYGNIAQMNFMVGYDLKKKTVSFKPTKCGSK
ncbi:aspartic proteinase CDR1-like [Impatiens glandulifera]|uniref:aspartic proteinase CDR1-like n=1 Tax=Impatiens glandulifera TaxID=253017 RepID=UPI001FB083B2|nr:aspartic proteinase CDR1-like [Impatiens glandulifera]